MWNLEFQDLCILTETHHCLCLRQNIMKYLRDERNVPILFPSWNSQSQCSWHLVQWLQCKLGADIPREGLTNKPRSFLKIYNTILCNPSSQLFETMEVCNNCLHTHTLFCAWNVYECVCVPRKEQNNTIHRKFWNA